MINKELLKYYRELNNLDYKTLSKKLKCPKRVIELWETGDIIPKEEDIKALASLYEINPKTFYVKKESKFKSFILIILLFALGIICGLFLNNVYFMIITPILNVFTYLLINKLFSYSYDLENTPKSLFGINILENDIKIYLLEANIIASIYILITILFRIIDFNLFIPDITIINDYNINEILIMVISYVALMILSFIIEFIFGKIMLMKYKGE